MNFILDNIYYIGAFGLIFIGLYILLTKYNLIKMIIGLSVMDTGVNLLLITIGYVKKGTAPIFSKTGLNPRNLTAARQVMVDPVPQALVLTAIVIGVAVLAMALSLAIRLYQHYGTLDMRKIKDERW